MLGFKYCIQGLAGMALLVAFGLGAANVKAPLDLTKEAADVQAQIGQIRKEMGDGQTYSEIKAEQREKVIAALGRIDGAVDRGNGKTLSPTDQVSAFNDQEVVNSILTQARADSRMICKRQKSVGSNMITPQCMTVAQRRTAREQGKQDLNDMHTMNTWKD